MKALKQNVRFFSELTKTVPKSIHTLFIVSTTTVMMTASIVVYADRFDPPSINASVQQFDERISGNLINVDFILAHVLNNGRKTVREVGEITNTFENILNNTTVFTNAINNSTDSASAGSVVIPVGTSADTIIVVNQNEGDSIAIQR